MTFEAHAALAADMEFAVEPPAVQERRAFFPAHEHVADPAPGWATRHPDRALAFLFVSPRDCSAVDELMAL